MLKRIPPIFKNFYVLGLLFFFVWMLVFDSNDLISTYKMRAKRSELENEKAYYIEKIKEVEKDRSELLGNNELLEKYAREKYLMKKETEDIFIVAEKD